MLVVIGALGSTPPKRQYHLNQLGIKNTIWVLQKSALLQKANALCKVVSV